MARATAARSSASSASVELTKTRSRWSGVRIATSPGCSSVIHPPQGDPPSDPMRALRADYTARQRGRTRARRLRERNARGHTQPLPFLVMTETQTNTPTGPLTLRRAGAPERLVARGELPLRRPDLPARQPAAARAAARRARQAAPARPLGHDARAELHLRPPEPRHPRARPRRDLRHRARARRSRGWWPTPTSRAPTARSTRA